MGRAQRSLRQMGTRLKVRSLKKEGARRRPKVIFLKMTAAEKMRRRRIRHKDNGQCSVCNNYAVIGRSMCSYHLDKQRERYRAEAEWKRENNICFRCGKPKEKNNSRNYCRNCLTIRNIFEKLMRVGTNMSEKEIRLILYYLEMAIRKIPGEIKCEE